MTRVDEMEIIGWIGVIIGFIVPIAQLRRMIKTKRTKDISIIMYATLLSSIIFKMIYSFDILDWVFMVTYVGALILNGTVFILIIADRFDYNRRKQVGST